jgi:hypothetical protein
MIINATRCFFPFLNELESYTAEGSYKRFNFYPESVHLWAAPDAVTQVVVASTLNKGHYALRVS